MNQDLMMTVGYWDEEIKKNGINYAREFLLHKESSPMGKVVALAIAKYDKKQEDKRLSVRDEREQKILKLAEEANRIAEESVLRARRANTISIISALLAALAILVAIFKN